MTHLHRLSAGAVLFALAITSTACGSNDRADLPSSSTRRPEPTSAPSYPAPAEAYLRHCANCHGSGGEGGSGPPLDDISSRMGAAQLVGTVSEGKPPSMPAFGATLSSAEIREIAEYVRSELG